MRFAFLLALLVVSSCRVQVHACYNGADGLDEAIAYAAVNWPDVEYQTEFLLISCKDQDLVESISSCGLSSTQKPESCVTTRRAPGSPARIIISHDEDAALSACHELQHLRDAVWFTPDGCQSHDTLCNYNAYEVERCEEAVRLYRGAE